MSVAAQNDDRGSECRPADELWLEFGRRLRSFVRGRVPGEQDAEDVLQDVFLKIHQEACSVKNPDKAQAWVYRIARNAVADFYRSRGRRQLAAEVPVDQVAETLADDTDPSDVHEEVLGWLEPLIDDLPPKYGDALRLADVHGLTQREVAERLGLSLSGAKSRVQRARGKLGELLAACCQVELGAAGRVVEYRRLGDEPAAC